MANRKKDPMLRFYWNGIKENGGKLQLCYYWPDKPESTAHGEITIYARHYQHFSAGIWAAFAVRNDTDLLTDYIQADRFRVTPGHPHYAAIVAAFHAKRAHCQRVADARDAKRSRIGGVA